MISFPTTDLRSYLELNCGYQIVTMIDIDHLEVVERKILQRLQQLKFSGLVLMDDITNHPDPVVKESMSRVWRSIKDTKYDVTKYGHWSGTGIVVMNSDITLTM